MIDTSDLETPVILNPGAAWMRRGSHKTHGELNHPMAVDKAKG
jgi:hypothetical protein